MNFRAYLQPSNGRPPRGESVRAFTHAGLRRQATSQRECRTEEAQAARRAIPLWRPSPGVAIR